MATAIRFEWLDEGFQQIIDSQGVEDLVYQSAVRIKDAAGDGFAVVLTQTSKLKYNRGVALVVADTEEAKIAEATDKVLSKAVQRCRVS